MANEKQVVKSKMRTIINGLGDEVACLALAHINEKREPVSVARRRYERGIREDFASRSHEPPHERRAALLRLAAKVTALLALDEVVRGGREIEKETEQLDALGHFQKRTG